MSAPATSVTVAGPAVPTAVMFTPSGRVRLRLDGLGDVVELEPALVVDLFALGLRTPEPDRDGWVEIGELGVDDEVTFAVGAASFDRDAAIRALRRAVERALHAAVTDAGEPSPER